MYLRRFTIFLFALALCPTHALADRNPFFQFYCAPCACQTNLNSTLKNYDKSVDLKLYSRQIEAYSTRCSSLNEQEEGSRDRLTAIPTVNEISGNPQNHSYWTGVEISRNKICRPLSRVPRSFCKQDTPISTGASDSKNTKPCYCVLRETYDDPNIDIKIKSHAGLLYTQPELSCREFNTLHTMDSTLTTDDGHSEDRSTLKILNCRDAKDSELATEYGEKYLTHFEDLAHTFVEHRLNRDK